MTDANADQEKTGATGSNPDLDVGLKFTEGTAPKAVPSVIDDKPQKVSIGIPQDFAPSQDSKNTPDSLPTTKLSISPPSSTAAPSPSANSSTQAPPAQGGINTDIEKILREVKLPERRDFRASADAIQAKPASPETMTVTPPTQAEIASAERSASGKDKAIASVHTLKDDLQHVVKEKKISLVRAVALEQDKKRTEDDLEEQFGRAERRKRVFGMLFATFMLFGLGLAALFGVYFVMLGHSASDIQQLNSIVFAEQSVGLPLENVTPSDLKRRIAATRQNQSGSLGSITRIVPLLPNAEQGAQPRLATTPEFFTAIGANPPEELLRSVSTDFFLGLHVVDKNSPVIVVPVTNYSRAFAAMLSWETTMNADLSPAFTPVPATVLDANGIPSQRIFVDDVMRNYDVRELKDDQGEVQLYYSFPNPNLLIIAESPYSFPELLSRLQSVRRL